MSEGQTIAAGQVVSMHYTLTLESGEVVDSSEGADPLAYLHGHGNIVPGLESALEGKATGEKLNVSVPPEAGYGNHEKDAVQIVPRSQFPDGVELSVGQGLQVVDQDQNPMLAQITGIEGDNITVDFNHPLAGETLNFAVEVVSVREATPDELEQGQAAAPE